MYDFAAQLIKGQQAEHVLDSFFAERFIIRPASRTEQRDGIDRHFTNRETGQSFTIDYKADWTAAQTGNGFLETISVDSVHKSGWAIRSKAFRILYYIPPDGLLYVLRRHILHSKITLWSTQYPARQIPNQGYMTHGLLIPLVEFEAIAETIISNVPVLNK